MNRPGTANTIRLQSWWSLRLPGPDEGFRSSGWLFGSIWCGARNDQHVNHLFLTTTRLRCRPRRAQITVNGQPNAGRFALPDCPEVTYPSAARHVRDLFGIWNGVQKGDGLG